jgi:hypothetical protein
MPDLADRGGPVTVARFDWEPEAFLARARLTAAGVDAYVPEWVMGSVFWHYGKALGGIRVQVSAEDEEDARAILDEPAVETSEAIAGDGDALADRTLRAAVFSYLAQIPLVFYAGWLLLRLLTSGESLGVDAKRKAIHAAILILPPFAVMAVVGALAVGRLY